MAAGGGLRLQANGEMSFVASIGGTWGAHCVSMCVWPCPTCCNAATDLRLLTLGGEAAMDGQLRPGANETDVQSAACGSWLGVTCPVGWG